MNRDAVVKASQFGMAPSAPTPSLEQVLYEVVSKIDKEKASPKPSLNNHFTFPQIIKTEADNSNLDIRRTQSVPNLKPVALSPESFSSPIDSPKSMSTYDSPRAYTRGKSPLNSPKGTAGKSRTKRKHNNMVEIRVKDPEEFRKLVEQYTAKPNLREPCDCLWDYPLPSSCNDYVPDLPGLSHASELGNNPYGNEYMPDHPGPSHASELGNNPNDLCIFNNFGYNFTPPTPPDIYKLQTS